MHEFPRMKRLPPYVFAVINELKMEARHRGEDIVDLGMGNPDQATPKHIVAKLCEAVSKGCNHRYSASRGITGLRKAICDWYGRRYDVDLDPEREAIATIGAKEGISHLVLATISPGEIACAPSPTYPIHPYSVIIAGGEVRSIPLVRGRDFFADLQAAVRDTWPRPKLIILSFPHNPTTEVVDYSFFEQVVDFAREHNIMVIHDLAYADLVFDGYKAPSFLQVPGAKEVGVEVFSCSKSYNMPGWRLGFVVGNQDMVGALTRIKSYLDYGVFQPIQIAGICALNGPQKCVSEIVDTYRERRDVLCEGLTRAGWPIEKPKATMFVWAPIPEQFRHLGSVEFSKLLIREAKVAVSPGLGFGEYGDDHVRFALVENPMRTRRGIRRLLRAGQGVGAKAPKQRKAKVQPLRAAAKR
jgi:alanine-synthesizing transaminase